jgi:PhnB protein
MSTSPSGGAKTDGFQTVATPYLSIKGAESAIEFYQKAFGATEIMRLRMPNGKVAHAQIKIGAALIMMADTDDKYHVEPPPLGASPVVIALQVESVDAFVARAVEAGAKVVIPVADQFYGERSGRLVDPFGHVWIISTRTEDLSPAEVQKRFDALCGKG